MTTLTAGLIAAALVASAGHAQSITADGGEQGVRGFVPERLAPADLRGPVEPDAAARAVSPARYLLDMRRERALHHARPAGGGEQDPVSNGRVRRWTRR